MDTDMNTVPGLFALEAAPFLPALSPVQALALKNLERISRVAKVSALTGTPGSGRSTVLRHFAQQHAGVVINAADMAQAAAQLPANQFEDAIGERLLEAIRAHDLVVIDDLQYFTNPGSKAGSRPGFFRAIIRRAVQAARGSKRIVLCGRPPESWESNTDQFGEQAAVARIAGFGSNDYAAILENILGAGRMRGIDAAMIFRYSSYLNGYQLALVAALLEEQAVPTTQDVIDMLEAHVVSSNTRITEVENISLAELPGHENIIEALEQGIILPLENRELAASLGLRPKRGVLLFGPPGTGKTSIGRALAHRMRGKFFLIDGSFVSEPPGAFFGKFENVVREAKEHAPSVLFIDDADVLFKIDHIAGLSRYLLSLLDGLESATSSHVCVMMTAMNIKPIPEALLRSGRVELWLETRLPDAPTRARILARWLQGGLPGTGSIDLDAAAAITEGFTPADLRRVIGDAKSLYAVDMVRGTPPAAASSYLQGAITAIVEVRNRMADQIKDDGLRLKGGKYPGLATDGQCGW